MRLDPARRCARCRTPLSPAEGCWCPHCHRIVMIELEELCSAVGTATDDGSASLPEHATVDRGLHSVPPALRHDCRHNSERVH